MKQNARFDYRIESASVRVKIQASRRPCIRPYVCTKFSWELDPATSYGGMGATKITNQSVTSDRTLLQWTAGCNDFIKAKRLL